MDNKHGVQSSTCENPKAQEWLTPEFNRTQKQDPQHLHQSNTEFTFTLEDIAFINKFFMFNKEYHKVQDCIIRQKGIFDHSGLNLKINLDRKPKTTLWRLNFGLLNNTFKSKMANK